MMNDLQKQESASFKKKNFKRHGSAANPLGEPVSFRAHALQSGLLGNFVIIPFNWAEGNTPNQVGVEHELSGVAGDV